MTNKLFITATLLGLTVMAMYIVDFAGVEKSSREVTSVILPTNNAGRCTVDLVDSNTGQLIEKNSTPDHAPVLCTDVWFGKTQEGVMYYGPGRFSGKEYAFVVWK